MVKRPGGFTPLSNDFMQLPFLNKQEPPKVFFVALLIKPYRVGAILFEEVNSKLFILANHEVEVDRNTSDLTSEELLEAADKAVSFVESSLTSGSTLEKTIFSVPYDWVEEGKIKKDYLVKLKKVCDDLGLIPVGYIVAIEAAVSFLGNTEGAPVSALFVEVAHKKAVVYLVRAGKIIEVHSGNIEESILSTVETLFKKIERMDVLPSKIILLEYKDSEQTQQDFLGHTWPKDIPFLHLPQVMVLERGFENEATISGVANQMDLEVLQDVKTPEDNQEKEPQPPLENVDAEEFGFLEGKDIASEPLATERKIDVADHNNTEEVQNVKEVDEPDISYFKESSKSDESFVSEEIKDSKKMPVALILSQAKAFAQKIKIPHIQALPAGGNQTKIRIGAAIVGAIVMVLLFLFIYYNFILHAIVTISSDKKAIDKTSNIVFSQNPTSDTSIKIDTVDEDVKGDDTKNSTGTKETGDRAQGSVTIYNKTDNEKTFPKGTIISGANSLEFVTQADVTIASTSAFSTSLSSADVKIQASTFGKEYNLPSGSNFTIKGFSASDFIAKNSSATAGGTKKETTVVSQKDLSDLLASIIDKLQQEAINKAKSSITSSQDVLPGALSSEVEDKSYTKKVGDESGSVGISAQIKYSIATYGKDQLQKVTEALSAGQVPGTYSIKEGDSKVEITNIKINKDNTASATLHVNAVYIPTIQNDLVVKQIKGKSQSSAEKQIKSITGVTDVSIIFKNSIPGLPKMLPQNVKNITLQVND